MYLQWEYDETAAERIRERDWETKDMSPVLADEGDTFELTQLASLYDERRRFYGLDDTETGEMDIAFTDTWPDESATGQERVCELSENAADASSSASDVVIHQPHLKGDVGAYTISGKADVLLLESTADGVRPLLFEVKSSSRQKVHHRYQATIYAMMLEQMLDGRDVSIDTPSGRVPVKIITPDNDLTTGPAAPEGFSTVPYRAKLQLKLEAGGSFDQTILGTDFESTTNRIARRCSGCEYEPVCMTRGVESRGLELLGLQAGTQESLHNLGIHDIEDFATLFDHPPNGSVHWDYSALEPRDDDLTRRVRQEADISNLQKRAQIAYRFLAEVDDEYGRDGPDFYPHPLRGTGNNIPADEHGQFDTDWTEWGGPDYPSGSLVRVYLYVQQDFAQDRVTLLSAYVACTLTGEQRQVTELPEEIPTSTPDKQTEEDRLFESFLRELTAAIDDVAPNWREHPALSDLGLGEEQGFLHLYIYSDTQRDALMDAIRRHPTSNWQRPLRTLLGLRDAIDQDMVSILQNDFRKRWALRFPGLGAIQTVAQFQWNDDWFDWRDQRDDERVPLHEFFEQGVFDSAIRYRPLSDGSGRLSLNHNEREPAWTPDDQRLARWVYPVQNREADQIPIEYIWGLHDRLDPSIADDPDDIRPYLYRDDDWSEPISEGDISLFASRFSRVPHHIERTIETTNKYANDKFANKEPIDLDAIQEFGFDERTLDEVCVEYQQLEYQTQRDNIESYYCQPLAERVDSGSSLLFRCTGIDETRGEIRGKLLLSDRREYDPTEHGGIIGGPLSVTSGDFMVLTRLTDDVDADRPELTRRTDPTSIGNSTTVIVDKVDEAGGTITIKAPYRNGWPYWGQYTVRHRGWSTESEAKDEEWKTYVEEGAEFVVDPMFDQVTQERAYEALEHATDAPVRRWIRELYNGERDAIPIDGWDADPVNDYLDAMEATEEFDRPNTEQENLIKDVDHGIVILQGPPGTGKTRYTVAPAVLGRAHSAIQNGESFTGVVSAVSHSAVNEALESILELREQCPAGTDPRDIELVRVSSSAGQGIDDDRVREIQYNSDDVEVDLESLYTQYLAPDSPNDQRALFFGPPVSIRSFLNKMIRTLDDIEYDRISELMAVNESDFFDLAIIDEASMMDLPLCFLLGSFVHENGQLVLVGDHRQMQPIQKHEWEDEDREPIERHTPFLSALDFLRFLRGEDVDIEYIERESPDIDGDEALPVYRLRETHRLPEESARMHTELFYQQDGIELVSAGENRDLPAVTGPLSSILDSTARVTLLVHDENHSEKSNPVEQALITELLAPFTIHKAEADSTEEDSLSAGVVVPFRAQRRDVIGVVPENAAVDTVERFQGGQRDLMVLSMTASDRGYISQISEFLLDPNRFNVGASRMKRKLIVIASAGLFEESSDDVETFDDQKAWISFYQAMGGLAGDFDEYRLDKLVNSKVRERFLTDTPGATATRIRVYSGYDR
jgi:uncharacterized protein